MSTTAARADLTNSAMMDYFFTLSQLYETPYINVFSYIKGCTGNRQVLVRANQIKKGMTAVNGIML